MISAARHPPPACRSCRRSRRDLGKRILWHLVSDDLAVRGQHVDDLCFRALGSRGSDVECDDRVGIDAGARPQSRERYKRSRTDDRFQPDLCERGYVRDADGSVSLRGFAGGTVIPGLCGKCAHGRSRIADTPVNITCAGRGSRIGVVPQGYMALASHSGSCERGCGDQCSRQKFNFSRIISPLDMKSQQRVASLWKWSSDRLIKVTFAHIVSTPRKVGRVVRSFTQLEFFTTNWAL